MKRPDYTNQIRKRIKAANAGTVFVTADFTDIAEKKTVNMALLRFAETGLLKKVMFGVYFKTGVYIQAIKALGKDNITEQTIAHMKKFLNENQKARMLEEAKPITSWVYEVIRKICIDN